MGQRRSLKRNKKKRYTEPNANEMQHIKICGTQPNSAEMEIYSSDA